MACAGGGHGADDVLAGPGAGVDADAADGAVDADQGRQLQGGLAADEGVVEFIAEHADLPVDAPDRAAGTGLDAGAAVAALGVVDRLAHRQGRVGQDAGEADGGAVLAGDQQGTLADPAEAGAGGDGLVLEGGRAGLWVDIGDGGFDGLDAVAAGLAR